MVIDREKLLTWLADECNREQHVGKAHAIMRVMAQVRSGAFDIIPPEGQIADDANSDLNEALEENEQLRQERDMYKSSSEAFYERLKKIEEERQKLIDGLLAIMDIASEDGVHWKLNRCYTMARDILKEVIAKGDGNDDTR